MQKFDYEVAIVGAGPAGATAAKIIAEQDRRVLLLEKRSKIGMPVQCAEFIPLLIANYCHVPSQTVAQEINELESFLPDGSKTTISAPGYVLYRELFDQHLVVEALSAGASLHLKAQVVEAAGNRLLVKQGHKTREITARIIIGADGPDSVVRHSMGLAAPAMARAYQAEIVLDKPHKNTKVFFHEDYFGGYAWLFPKGKTANLGLGMVAKEKGAVKKAWSNLLSVFYIDESTILGLTGGQIPIGGLLSKVVQANLLLIGDAAGTTHPLTGAGIANAVISGTIAGKIVGQALQSKDIAILTQYESELQSHLGNSLKLATLNREYQENNWSKEPELLSAVLRKTWIAFREYGRRKKEEVK